MYISFIQANEDTAGTEFVLRFDGGKKCLSVTGVTPGVEVK